MNTNLVLVAQQFCNNYFCDVSLDQHQFLNKVRELLKDIDSMDDKLLLLSEIIRISKLHYSIYNSYNLFPN